MKVRLELTLLWLKPPCISYTNGAVLMLISRNLHTKSCQVSFKTRLTPASLSLEDQATKHSTVKWSIVKVFHFPINMHSLSFYSAETESNYYVEDVESVVIRNNSYSFSRSNFPSGHLKNLIFLICLISECVRKKTIYERKFRCSSWSSSIRLFLAHHRS